MKHFPNPGQLALTPTQLYGHLRIGTEQLRWRTLSARWTRTEQYAPTRLQTAAFMAASAYVGAVWE